MNNKKMLNIVTLCILILVPLIKFLSMNLEYYGLINNYGYINPAIVLYISIPFLLYLYLYSIIKEKRKLDIFDYLMYALIFTSVLSTIFSIDKNIAIFGKVFRQEGLLSILSYLFLFIDWKIYGTKEDIKKYIKIITIIAIINSIFSLLQIYTNFNFILRYKNSYMASGLCGNPNFLGSLLTTIISIATASFLIDKKFNIKNILIIILLYISLIDCQSTGPFFTYILTIIFLIIYLYKKINKSNLIKLLLILLITYPCVSFINRLVYNNGQMKELEINGIERTISSGGNGRLEIWKNSLDIVKKNPIVGVGYDNFYLAYPNESANVGFTFSITDNNLKEDIKYVLIYDNAHNVYLHNLVSTGILGLISYLLMCLFVFIKGLKLKSKEGIVLLSGFVAYSIQAFANISVIQVAPIYYLIMGLILSIKE